MWTRNKKYTEKQRRTGALRQPMTRANQRLAVPLRPRSRKPSCPNIPSASILFIDLFVQTSDDAPAERGIIFSVKLEKKEAEGAAMGDEAGVSVNNPMKSDAEPSVLSFDGCSSEASCTFRPRTRNRRQGLFFRTRRKGVRKQTRQD